MAELKNTCKGLWAEVLVYHKVSSRGWKFVGHRQKLKFGEVDLIFSKDQKCLMLEVKTLHNSWMSFERISKEQIIRLKRNRLLLSRTSETLLFAAFVDPKGRIKFVDLSD